MAGTFAEYFNSDEFVKRMKRVSAQSRPFDNAATSEQVYLALAEAARKRRQAPRKA